MKLGEMADLLEGLANTLEKHMGKTAVNDLREVSKCFRKFSDDTVARFCRRINDAGQQRRRSTRTGGNQQETVTRLVEQIADFRSRHKELDYQHIDTIIQQVRKLTNTNIKALGQQVGCPVSGTKAAMVSRLESWMRNLKMSADQADFTLSSMPVN